MMHGINFFDSFFDNTNLELLMRGRNPFKDVAEALRFQVVARLVTLFEFGKLDELWSTVGRKYMPAVEFGTTGMDGDRSKEDFLGHIW